MRESFNIIIIKTNFQYKAFNVKRQHSDEPYYTHNKFSNHKRSLFFLLLFTAFILRLAFKKCTKLSV